MPTYATPVALVAIASLPFLVGALLAMLFRRARRVGRIVAGFSTSVFLSCVTVLLLLMWGDVREVTNERPPPPDSSAWSPVRQATAVQQIEAEPSTKGKHGRVRVCLTDKAVPIGKQREIILPASTVFDDVGPLVGDRADYRTWQPGSGAGDAGESLVLVDAVNLTAASRCAEARAMVLTVSLRDAGHAAVAEGRLYRMSDVLYYPVPQTRPGVEVAKLIDDGSIRAVVTEDIEGAQLRPSSTESKPDLLAKCRAEAKLLSYYMKARVTRQTADVVLIEKSVPEEVTYDCRRIPTVGPHIFISWKDQARPPRETLDLVAIAGEHLLGVPRDEMLQETEVCITKSIKTRWSVTDREFRGAKIDCQARPPGGVLGSVNMYRRFGRAGSLEN
ncbi:hypothetical protein ACLBXJ_02855 [Methylobacterium mesophilicum]